jgi:hypothetical protein
MAATVRVARAANHRNVPIDRHRVPGSRQLLGGLGDQDGLPHPEIPRFDQHLVAR